MEIAHEALQTSRMVGEQKHNRADEVNREESNKLDLAVHTELSADRVFSSKMKNGQGADGWIVARAEDWMWSCGGRVG